MSSDTKTESDFANQSCKILESYILKGNITRNRVKETRDGCEVSFVRGDVGQHINTVEFSEKNPLMTGNGFLAAPRIFAKDKDLRHIGCDIESVSDLEHNGEPIKATHFKNCPIYSEEQLRRLANILVGP